MGVIESIDEDRVMMQTWAVPKFLYPLEDYVFYSLEVDGDSIDDNSGE